MVSTESIFDSDNVKQLMDLLEDMQERGRDPDENLVKIISIHAACIVAFGHLLSLLNHTSSTQRRLVLLHIIAPLLPVTLLICNIMTSVVVYMQRRFRRPASGSKFDEWRYYVSVILGQQATPQETTTGAKIALGSIDSSMSLFQDVKTWGSVAFGRIIVLIFFIVQCASALAIYRRRVDYGQSLRDFFVYAHKSSGIEAPNSDWATSIIINAVEFPHDTVNAIIVANGLVTGVWSVCLSLMNTEWFFIDPRARVSRPNTSKTASTGFVIVATLIELPVFVFLVFRDLNVWRYCDADSARDTNGVILADEVKEVFEIILLVFTLALVFIAPYLLVNLNQTFNFSISGILADITQLQLSEANPFQPGLDVLHPTLSSATFMATFLVIFKAFSISLVFVGFQYMRHYLSEPKTAPCPLSMWKDPHQDHVWTF